MNYASPCGCLGRPLRFEPGQCFTCGRFLKSEIGAVDHRAPNPGYGALAYAIERKRRELERLATPAPRHGRRVVIDLEPAPQLALRSVRGRLGVC